MTIRLLIITCLISLLAACSSDQVKEEQEVAVEDLTSSSAAGADGTDGSGATTYGTDGSGSSAFSELDDPASQLSVRIIYFEYDSTDIKSEYRPVVEAHSQYLSRNPTSTITLEGHADERGSREYNLALGERRAQSVKQQMMLLGAAGNQVRIVSYGEERPAVDGHDDYSWQQNRRVEIIY
ncbi:MAG: peptidoglycan-associated lipoprotein Pal [Pseudomonadota bacterium]